MMPLVLPGAKGQYLRDKLQKKRNNTVVLGDIIQDAEICHDEDYATVLRVGFMNTQDQSKIDYYSEHFDMLINGDGSIGPVVKMLDPGCPIDDLDFNHLI